MFKRRAEDDAAPAGKVRRSAGHKLHIIAVQSKPDMSLNFCSSALCRPPPKTHRLLAAACHLPHPDWLSSQAAKVANGTDGDRKATFSRNLAALNSQFAS